MGFSKEWERLYKNGQQMSLWPWSSLVSLASRYGNLREGMKVLELGCGAGANIPFFIARNVDYYAIEGSDTMVKVLKEKFPQKNVHISQGDFTRSLPQGEYQLIVDRSALTHNQTMSIKSTIELIKNVLADDGRFIGIDWFSTKSSEYERVGAQDVDENTKLFTEGYFAGLGHVHFSDEQRIRDLFREFSFIYMAENVKRIMIPSQQVEAVWDFVVCR